MASFYLPMALSYASNLSHLPPINGLYAFAFQPLIYAFLGSCPQMVVGPEAAGSLLVGSVVRSQINKGHAGDEDSSENARVAGVVTGLAGAAIFAAGLARLGFLDSVLSKPFLRGFISAIGFVIIVDQLIPEMGLAGVAEKVAGVAHGSSITKLGFLVQYVKEAHGLTCAVAGISFVVIMSFRYVHSCGFPCDRQPPLLLHSKLRQGFRRYMSRRLNQLTPLFIENSKNASNPVFPT